MGEPKMSLDIGGKTLLQKTVENAISSKAEYINVVLNKDYKFLEEDLKNISTNIIWNDDSNRGMSYSIALGIRNSQHHTENIMILLADQPRSEEHTSELQSRGHLVCRLLLEKKKTKNI